MTTKDLWKLIGLLFVLWITFEVGTSILGLFLAWMPYNQGETVAGVVMFVLCLIVFLQEIKKRFMPQKPAKTVTHSTAAHQKKSAPKPKVPTPEKKAPSVFAQDLQTLSLQVKRMDQKLSQLDAKLGEQFDLSSLSTQKFRSIIKEADQLFEKNCVSIKERIDLFDELGYRQLVKNHQEYSREALPYQKSFQYVKEKLAQNENLINQINSLLIEVSQIDEQATKAQDELILSELDNLIEQTRLYSKT